MAHATIFCMMKSPEGLDVLIADCQCFYSPIVGHSWTYGPSPPWSKTRRGEERLGDGALFPLLHREKLGREFYTAKRLQPLAQGSPRRGVPWVTRHNSP